MSSGKRALLLALPLLLFAVAGSLYTPPGKEGEGRPSGSQVTSLPPLPAWASMALPDFSRFRDTTEKKAAFFSFLYPRIVLINSRILLQRRYLASLSGKYPLAPEEILWLATQAQKFGIDGKYDGQQLLQQLQRRLDIIPPSLVLAQAANESAWGTSRFATDGNNLFGQWCFTRGCGLVPLERSQNAVHEVRVFSSPYRSVHSYIQNLNTHSAYQLLRTIRQQQRQNGTPLSGLELARGLQSYSSRGVNYVQEIQTIIRHNNLGYYDDHFSTLIQDLDHKGLSELASFGNEALLLPGSTQQKDKIASQH